MEKKLKIAFLNIYNGLVDRGAETFVKELAERLSKSYGVVVFQSGEASGYESYGVVKVPTKIDPNVPRNVHTLRGRFFLDYKSLRKACFTLKVLPHLLKEKFDVVIPVNGGWQPALVRLVTWLYGGKMIISGQSGMGWDDRNNLWCFPDCFFALSSKAARWAKKVNPFVKVKYVPNGVDLGRFTPEGKVLKLDLKKPVVLCVAALTRSKRIDLVIKAVAQLKGVSLLVIGDGNLKEELKALGARLLGNRLQLAKVPYDDISRVYRCANIFTLPSEKTEAFGNVLVEAMASGLPVVATDDSIRKEIVGDAGLFVDPTDTGTYAGALEKAIKMDWRDKPGRQAEKFDWDRIAKQYEKIFEEMI